MTEDAKSVINCVWETKGRYGLNIVLGTLLGANRARLKELGTVHYRTYGALKDRTESELRLLINQLLLDGYLYRTADKYSVIRMGNIEPLKDPNAHVLIRTYKDQEPERRTKNLRRKSTDSLTKTGYELFEILRQLRLTIAREEGLPPYIIFNDKTLIDMSIKAPTDKQAILNVSGVGEAKYEKYGGRFIDAVTAFMENHPEEVTSIREDDDAENIHRSSPDRVRYNRMMNRPDGAGTSWTEEEDRQLDDEYGAGMKISEIAKVHDRTRGAISARLKKHGLIE